MNVPVARDSTERFADRVSDYVRARPGYPPQLPGVLMNQAALAPGDAVADVGAGTGILTRMLLESGLRVRAVEPNAAMRAAADRLLGGRSGYASLAGRAEATGLPLASVKLVAVAQAFHWFDPALAREEFARILVPGGQVALIWNVRRTAGAFAADYEALIQTYCPEYAMSGVPVQADETIIRRFFAPSGFMAFALEYHQQLDREALRARLLSSSYVPRAGQPGHNEMMAALEAVFDAHQSADHVVLSYDTRVFIGRL